MPQEEVPLYESKGKQLEKNQPKYPVGLSEEYIREAQQRREMAQKKDSSQPSNQKKKKKKGQSDFVKVVPADDLLQTSSYIGVEQVPSRDDQWTTVVGKGMLRMVLKEEVKPVPKPSSKPKEIKQPVTEPAKRVRNLKKKLKEIEQIEEKRGKGAKLEKDQLDKLARKRDVEDEISRLVSDFELS